MSGVKGAPSPKPQSLKSPVPNEAALAEVEEFFASEPGQFAAPAAAPAEAEAAQFLGEAPSAEIPADQFAPEPSFAEANLDQLKADNIVTRIQAGLASNDQAKLGFLKRKFGENNAVMKNDKIYFRRSNGEKLKPLDPETLELINDILPDFSREIVTEAALVPFEAAGYGLAGPTGAYGGRVIGVPIANKFADQVAESLGVQTPEQGTTKGEHAIGIVAEAAFPFIGRTVGKQIAKRLPGTEAYKAAKAAGQREIVALDEHSKEVVNAINRLEEQQRVAYVKPELVGMDIGNTPIMANQLGIKDPDLLRTVTGIERDPKFINAQAQLAQDTGNLALSTLREIGARGIKGPWRPEELASKVTNAVADINRAEGEALRKFTTKAMSKLKNERQTLPPETKMKIEELLRAYGFRPRTKKTDVHTKYFYGLLDRKRNLEETVWNPPSPKELTNLQGTFQLNDKGDLQAAINALIPLAKDLDQGIRPSDLERLRNVIGEKSDSFRGKAAGAKFAALSGDLRKFYRATIEKGLDNDFEKAAFNSQMDDIFTLRNNIDVIKRATDENASARAIVKNFFTGKENLPRIKAIKAIDQNAYANLKKEWIDLAIGEFADTASPTGLNSTKALNAFKDSLNAKYGEDFVREIMDDGVGPGFQTVKDLFTVSQRMEAAARGVKIENMSQAQKDAIADLGLGLLMNINFKSMNGVTKFWKMLGSGGDSAFMEILSRDGVDRYIAKTTGTAAEKMNALERVTNAVANYKVMKKIAASRPVKEVTKRGAKATVREEAQGLAE